MMSSEGSSSKPVIPIENIYYLLCYAWNELDQTDLVSSSDLKNPSVLNLLSCVLAKGLSRLIKRGIDRGYIGTIEETKSLRGKINLSESTAKCLFKHSRAVCSYDEFKADILHNQILKSTIHALLRVKGLDPDTKTELHRSYRHMPDISLIRVTPKLFHKVQLHRNNSFYEFLLRVCELIALNLLPTEE